MNDPKNILEFLDIDLQNLQETVEDAKDLKSDKQLYEQLLAISRAADSLKEALEDVKAIEDQAKVLIADKATQTLGPDWKIIKGGNYTIRRQFGGALYELIDEENVDDEFVKVKLSPNSRTIDNYRETHEGELPENVGLNEHRSVTIKIEVTENG